MHRRESQSGLPSHLYFYFSFVVRRHFSKYRAFLSAKRHCEALRKRNTWPLIGRVTFLPPLALQYVLRARSEVRLALLILETKKKKTIPAKKLTSLLMWRAAQKLTAECVLPNIIPPRRKSYCHLEINIGLIKQQIRLEQNWTTSSLKLGKKWTGSATSLKSKGLNYQSEWFLGL